MQQIISSATMRMTSIEIANLVNSRHDSVKRAIERLSAPKEDGTPAVIQLPPMVEVENNQSLSPNSRSKAYVFQGEKGKRDSIVVVAQLSPEFTARLVDRWNELENLITSSKPKIDSLQPIEQAKPIAEAVGVICDILRLPDSGRIAMLKSAMSPWPLIGNAIPNCSHDAPVSASGVAPVSAVSTLPISDIVEGWLSARTANVALEKAGLIQTMERKKRNGSISTFKSVTEKGLAYGKNIVDYRSLRETKPHWFISTADELKDIIRHHL